MARIEAATHIEARPDRVWSVLVDWEAQPAWMRDARSVTVLSPHREGVEVAVRARTDLAGLVVDDDMVVTDWQEGRRLGMRHTGRLLRGVGSFELEPTRHGTHVTWWEEILVPLGGVGDSLAEVFVVPAVTRTFRRSLAGLKRVCESDSVRP